MSILELNDAVFEIKSTNDTSLEIEDFDNAIVDHLLSVFKNDTNIKDLRSDNLSLQRVRESAEKVKCELSSVVETEINIPFITGLRINKT